MRRNNTQNEIARCYEKRIGRLAISLLKKIIVTEVKTQWVKHRDIAEGRIHITGRQS